MALLFARRGDHVIPTARRMDLLEALAQDAAALSGKLIPIEADELNRADLQKAVAAADAQFGRLDIVIANAGLGQRGSIVDSAWEDIEAVLRINVERALHTIRAAVPLLRRSGGGHIVMISSVLSLATGPYCAVYSATKTTINALAR